MARMALSCVTEPANPLVARAIAEFGAVDVWEGLLAQDGLMSKRARELKLKEVVSECGSLGIRFVIPGDDEWPAQVEQLGCCEPVHKLCGAPIGLWLRGGGDLAKLCARSVSIVGARAATAYGERAAGELACDLSDAGYAIISGGAFGIDAAAHRGCLAGRTPTIAVLAGGVNRAYPEAHASLFTRIAKDGVLVSELPPSEHPTKVRFLGRNRLIAALAIGTVIVEGAVRSGAKNSITWATSLGRITMAVPGPVTSAMSYSPHQLIRNAEAVLVTNSLEVLELVCPGAPDVPRPAVQRRATDDLSENELRVYEFIPGRGSRSAEELAMRAGLNIPVCLSVLHSLCDKELVMLNPADQWQLKPASHVAMADHLENAGLRLL
jgi:DNA processing protein